MTFLVWCKLKLDIPLTKLEEEMLALERISKKGRII